MRILFINMAVRPESISKLPNVGLAYVMSAGERAGFEFELIDIDAHRYTDEQVESMVRKSTCEVIAIGTLVSVYGPAKALFKMIRTHHPKGKIVVGNTLGTSIPRILLSKTEADICVIGEGELTFVDLIQALDEGRSLQTVKGIAFKEGGEYVQTPQRDLISDLDTIPYPNYDLFDFDIYLDGSRHIVPNPRDLPWPIEDVVAAPVSSARGCAFHCNFCFHAFQDRKYRFRSPESVVAEIKHWKDKYGANFVNFWDELTFHHIAPAERFADLMIEADMGVHWFGICRSELLVRRDGGPRVAAKMRKANCHGMNFALESGNPEILAFMNKKNTVNEFIEQCHVMQEANLDVYTSIIIGYPQESTQTIDDTFSVLTRARVYPSVGFLQLMPATPMFDLAKKRGLIQDDEEYLMKMGDRQDIRINFTQYDDEFLMDYTIGRLKELNATIETNVDESSLIKTTQYRAVKKKEHEDTFVQNFGVAGKVAAESKKEAMSEVLRTTNFTSPEDRQTGGIHG